MSLSFPSSDRSVSEVVLAVSPPVLSPAVSPSAPDMFSPSGKSGLEAACIWFWLSASAMELMSASGLWILNGPSSGRSPWTWLGARSELQLVMCASRLRSSLALDDELPTTEPEGGGWSGLGKTRGSVAARAGSNFSSTLENDKVMVKKQNRN